MNSEFEEYLGRQPVRRIPPEWRAEILRAAESHRGAAPRSVPEREEWWRQLLWPTPRGWAAVAGAWVLIVVLHCSAPTPSGNHVAAAGNPIDLRNLVHLQQQMEMMAQLPDWPRPEPAQARERPRTAVKVKQNIG